MDAKSGSMSQVVYIKVAEEGGIPIELPLENDKTILLSTIQAQFPDCTGLQYRVDNTGALRGIKLSEGRLFAPSEVWPDVIFYTVLHKGSKRLHPENGNVKNVVSKTADGKKSTDLIVLNLSWRTSESDLKKYFSNFGEVVMTEVKLEPDTQNSRGFGFVRFADYDAQTRCLAGSHHIDGRLCEVKIPRSKAEGEQQDISRKVYISNISEETTSQTLWDFFSSFGTVVKVFIPSPFRAFAFVTFKEASVATSLLGKDFLIDNKTIAIASAVPKPPVKLGSRQSYRPPYTQNWSEPRPKYERQFMYGNSDYQSPPANYRYYSNYPNRGSMHLGYASRRPQMGPPNNSGYGNGYYSQPY